LAALFQQQGGVPNVRALIPLERPSIDVKGAGYRLNDMISCGFVAV
jgi:hypothetical protein